MKIPSIFLPERNLGNKIKELFKEQNTKKPFKDQALYGAISSNMKVLLHTKTFTDDPIRIFWISDEHQTSRYECVKEIIDEIITGSGKKLAYETHNCYGNNFERKDFRIIMDKPTAGNFFQIIYTAHETTEKLIKKSPEYAPLLDRMLIISI